MKLFPAIWRRNNNIEESNHTLAADSATTTHATPADDAVFAAARSRMFDIQAQDQNNEPISGPSCVCNSDRSTIAIHSVATAIAGVFANFTNKTGKITEKLEDVDKTKSQGVSCQH